MATSNITPKGEAIHIGNRVVRPGERALEELPVARLFTGSWSSLPIAVINGRQAGPRLWLSAAIHGDELNGVEIIRQVLGGIKPAELAGTLLAVPVVNVFGLVHQTRYLPDRRDLNRSFPGSPRGSLASRLAHLFLEEVVRKCDYGIDLHTGSQHRTNLPQIRAKIDDSEIRRLAQAFGAPLMFTVKPLHGSLRETTDKLGIHYLLYEAGEPMRFNRFAVRTGVRGVRRVMAALGMLEFNDPEPEPEILVGGETQWLRANRTGSFILKVRLGERVAANQVIGTIADPVSDPFSTRRRIVKAPFDGVVIGYTNNPLVHQGDALVHLARVIS